MDTLRLPKRTKTTIQELAGLAIEHLPLTFSNSDLYPGRKAFFPLPLKKRPNGMADFLYIYVESKLSHQPKDSILGFTQEDVTDESGFYLFKKSDASLEGQTYPLDILLTDVIEDDSIRDKVRDRIAEIKKMVHLDEDYLDVANGQWPYRISNESFGFKTLQ